MGAGSRHIKLCSKQELNILTLASLYILEVTCFIRKYYQSLEQNFEVHKYNTRSKLDIHVKLHYTEVYKKSVIKTGTEVYSNLPGFIQAIDGYMAFKIELKLFLLFHVLLTVQLSIFISVINQLDAQNFCFSINLFHASTCFEHHALIIRRTKLHYTASGIITLKQVSGLKLWKYNCLYL